MTRPSLAGIDPLSPTPWSSRVAGTSNGVRVYTADGHPLPGCFSCGENDAVYESGDGALIAAAPDLLDAVRDVLALHQQHEDTGKCIECTYAPYSAASVPWPCPTVRALATHLDLTDPEGAPT